MIELIDRQAALDAIKFSELGREYDEVEKVQIFNPWQRVEDGLPVKGEIVIVSDGKRTWDVGQYHCLVSSDDRTKWWWKGHTIKTVKWWMRKKDALPEPPGEENK